RVGGAAGVVAEPRQRAAHAPEPAQERGRLLFLDAPLARRQGDVQAANAHGSFLSHAWPEAAPAPIPPTISMCRRSNARAKRKQGSPTLRTNGGPPGPLRHGHRGLPRYEE